MTEPNVIIMNGASSSGKSTFGRYLKANIGLPYFYLSSDQFVESNVLPEVDRRSENKANSWNSVRPRFFEAFHRTIKAFADAGNLVIVEHIVEHQKWMSELVSLLSSHSVLYIGVTCPLYEIDRREKLRGDRHIGEGRSHISDGIHTWSDYDILIDTFTHSVEENFQIVMETIQAYSSDKSIFRKELQNSNIKFELTAPFGT